MDQNNSNDPQSSNMPMSDKVKAFGDNVSQVVKEQAGVIEQSANQVINQAKEKFSGQQTDMNQSNAPVDNSGESEFKMPALELFAYDLVVGIGSTITLGIAGPWLLCWKFRAVASQTYFNGRQMTFDGRGGELFVNFIKWLILTIITLGIYGIWARRHLIAWVVKNTHEA